MNEIKAIETRYNGYRFRSRLEARWAVFFDTCSIKYEYEPEGFVLPSGKTYLPDFYLPDLEIYVEIKREGGDPGKAMEFGLTINNTKGLALFFGPPRQSNFCIIYNDYSVEIEDLLYINEFYFAPYFTGDTYVVGIQHVSTCAWWDYKMPYRYRLEASLKVDPNHADTFISCIDQIESGIKLANEARFEHGETPIGPKQ